jgi:diacylglycerol kinase (ATP)
MRENLRMTSPNPTSREAANAQKSRKGLQRMLHAFYYSLDGLKTAWTETAFRQEALAAVVMIPLAFWLGHGWVETTLLAGVVMLVMIVELLNTAVERAIDRIGPEWHEYSKHAKDFGSAAVLLSLLLAVSVWLTALYHNLLT